LSVFLLARSTLIIVNPRPILIKRYTYYPLTKFLYVIAKLELIFLCDIHEFYVYELK